MSAFLVVPAELVEDAMAVLTDVTMRVATVDQTGPNQFKVASALVDAGERGSCPPTALPNLSGEGGNREGRCVEDDVIHLSRLSASATDPGTAVGDVADAGLDATCDCGRHAPRGQCSECEANEAIKGEAG